MSKLSTMMMDSTLRSGLVACSLPSMVKEHWSDLIKDQFSWMWRTNLVQNMERLCISAAGERGASLRDLIPKQPNIVQILETWMKDFVYPPHGIALDKEKAGSEFETQLARAQAILTVGRAGHYNMRLCLIRMSDVMDRGRGTRKGVVGE